METSSPQIDSHETITLRGETVSLSQAEIRLDLETPFESALKVCAILCAILGAFSLYMYIGKVRTVVPPWGVLALLCGAPLFWVVRTKVDCTYFLVNGKRCLDYSRSIFGHVTRYTVCSYDRIAITAVTGEENRSKYDVWWTYQAVLVLEDGTVIKVCDPLREDLDKANTVASTVGALVGCRTVEGVAERQLVVKVEGDNLDIEFAPFEWSRNALPKIVGLFLGLLFVGLVVFIMGL